MKVKYILFLVVLLFGFLPLASYSDCGDAEPNDIDKQCNEGLCGGTASEIKGCYLPPEPGKTCPEGYTKTPADDPNAICCCK